MSRRSFSVALAVAVAVGGVWVVHSDRGSALGPVTAMTPDEIVPNGFVGFVRHPNLSDRGETASVHDGEVQEVGFVHLDDADREPLVDGYGLTVSGDGCSALVARPNRVPVIGPPVIGPPVIGPPAIGPPAIGPPVSVPPVSVPPEIGVASIGLLSIDRPATAPPTDRSVVDFVVINRCTGGERLVLRLADDASVYGSNGFALSRDGRFAAIEVRGLAGPIVTRIDTLDPASRVDMPLTSVGRTVAEFGLDISDDGNIVVVSGSDGDWIEVAAWDVAAGSVQLVSAPGGHASGWASFPSVSGDGRHVAFASSRRLTGAELSTGPWVYVTDRQTGDTRLASAPGDASYATSISSDASQVAYNVSTPGCEYVQAFLDDLEFDCPPGRIDVAWNPVPGFSGGVQRETVSIAADGSVNGDHRHPALSGNGRWVAWVSQNGNQLLGSGDPRYRGQHAYLRRRDAGLSVGSVDFGTVVAPGVGGGTSTVTNTGRSTVTIASISPAPGEFVAVGGSCATGVSLPPGASCTVDLRFDSLGGARVVSGTLLVSEAGFDPVDGRGELVGRVGAPPTTTRASSTTAGTTTTVIATTATTLPTRATTTTVGERGPIPTITQAPTTTIPGVTVISAAPDPLDFGDAPVLVRTGIRTLTVTNTGSAGGTLSSGIDGEHPDDFEVVGGTCRVGTLNPGSSCTLELRMTAGASGPRRADLTVTSNGAVATALLSGIGRFDPRLAASPESVTERAVTTIIGQGFPPGEPVTMRIDTSDRLLTATPGPDGVFRIPLSPLGRLTLGDHLVRAEDVPSLYTGPEASLIVVLPTFSPQGPTGPAFAAGALVSRG